jgi:eukaryotic-like serine/threonine-protein kinase
MTAEDTPRLRPDATFATVPTGVVAGRYRVERQVGAGGMATVYRAVDQKYQRTVALKVMGGGQRYDAHGAQRFLREITIAANLTHPHILPLHDSGEIDGMPFYVMPFVDGPTLRAKLRAGGPLPVAEAVRILRDVADALAAAHAQGVVHRDIKPENIMMLGRSAIVADFGVAKALNAASGVGTGDGLTTTGVTAGTPTYMAPEQMAADPAIDQRADLYALGVVAYEMFAGATPFAGRTPTQMTAAIMTEEPPPLATKRPDLPPALTDLVARLLAKDPAARPATAGEVIDALDAIEISSPSVPGQTAAKRTPRRRSLRIVLGACAALLLAAGAFAIRSRPSALPACGTAALDSLWAGGNAKSVAVLPFTNTSGDTANEHFSDGLTDALISALGKVCGLRVAARASVFSLRGKEYSMQQIGAKLGAATVIDGGARRDGDRIKVSASLVSVKDNTLLWSDVYDRQATDVFAVQDEIANAIVSALHARPSGSAAPTLVGRPTRDLDAYELYLRGKSDAQTRDSARVTSALAELRLATQRDTGFALAYATLAEAYVRASTYTFLPLKDAVSLAGAAADRAIALDASLAEAYAARGFVLMQRLAFADAETALLRAIRLNPNLSMSHHYYSLLLTMEGRVAAAVHENDMSTLLDPLLPALNAHRGVLLCLKGDRAGARGALETAIASGPDQLSLYYLGLVDAADGHWPDAVVELESAYKRAPEFTGVRSALAYAYARVGKTKEAGAVVRPDGETNDTGIVERALREALVGNVDRAYALLQGGRWVTSINPVPGIINLRANPLLATFRSDPRYGALLREIGLDR